MQSIVDSKNKGYDVMKKKINMVTSCKIFKGLQASYCKNL